MSLPSSILDLIPQKGKMSFEQMLIHAQKDDGESSAIVKEDNIFLDDYGKLSNAVLVEYINQLIAAVEGYKGRQNGQAASKGLFVGLQEAEFFHPVYQGDSLTLKKYIAEEVSPVNFVQGIIERNGEKIASFITKIYELNELSELYSLPSFGQGHQQQRDPIINTQKPPAYLTSGMYRKLFSYLQNVKVENDSISFTIACPADFDAFDGHFPENPILPGIILLEIAGLAIILWMKEPVVLKYIKKMKISGIVLPYQVISWIIKIDGNNSPKPSFSAICKDKNEREISRFTGYFDEGNQA